MYSPSDIDRFWKYVHKTDTCWTWTGAKASQYKYGKLTLGRKRWEYAHRMSYVIHFGQIPDGMHVCHHCDNPPCVRPDHLFVGTPKDNMQDRDRKGRGGWQQPGAKFGPRPFLTHCGRGHDLSLTRGKQGRCIECQRIWWHKNKSRYGYKGTGNGRGVRPQQTHCQRGHEFTEANTYTYASGQRACKACVALRYQQRRRAA